MKAIHYMLFAAAVLILAACSKEEIPDNPGAQVELRLTSGLEVQTRAAHGLDTQVKDGEAVHVWVDDATTEKSLYSNNTLTAGSDGTLTGGETMYFPATGNNASIYAIHGNFAENTDYTNFWGAEQTHTVMQDQRSDGRGYAQSDLVYCKLSNVSRNGNPTTVGLTFEHLLSKVEVVLVQGAGKPTISKAEILNTLLNATFTPAKTDETVTVTASGTPGENPIEIDADLDGTTVNEAVIVPQTLVAGTDFIRITTTDGDERVYSLPADKTFESGKKYRFTITVTAPIVPPVFKLVDEAAVGDYLLQDGRVLGQESTLTPELASQVVGIVFYAGHHEKDGSDYANTGIRQQKCHGYAVALTDVHNDVNDRLCWMSIPGSYHTTQIVGVSTDPRDWNGYSNSRKFHEFVQKNSGYEMRHFPAAHACETYGNRTDQNGNYDWQTPLAAPDNTSGWFLPTDGQLTHLYGNASLLSARMTDVKDSTPANCDYKDKIHWFTPSSYWSSTENWADAERTTNIMNFDNGMGSVSTKTSTNYARAVLAF